MPLIRLAVAVRRYPRALRVLAGLVVMVALFATLLSAAEPAHARGVGGVRAEASSGRHRVPAPAAAPAAGPPVHRR